MSQGDLAGVRRLLGRPFTLEGPIVPGHGGRFAANGFRHSTWRPRGELLPKWGVYATLTRDLGSGRQWKSITNVGKRPTFNGHDVSVETHLLDEFTGDAPERIQVVFHLRLRDEQKFPSAEALKDQILSDVREAQQFFQRM